MDEFQSVFITYEVEIYHIYFAPQLLLITVDFLFWSPTFTKTRGSFKNWAINHTFESAMTEMAPLFTMKT